MKRPRIIILYENVGTIYVIRAKHRLLWSDRHKNALNSVCCIFEN